jgi:hypothetical protein
MKNKDFWDRLMVGLDDDERIVSPEIYLDNKDLYDKICGIAYLIGTPNGIDWVWERGLNRARQNGWTILKKVLIVRVRLPWNEPYNEWWIDHEELNAHRNEYEILEVQIRATPKDSPHEIKIMEPLEFEMNRENYVVVDAKYMVRWRFEPEEIKQIKKIRGDHHSVLSK